MGILHEGTSTFMIQLAEFFLEWEIFQIKIVEKIKSHILYSVIFFRKSAIYKTMWKNMLHPDTQPMTIYGKSACTNAT